MNEKIAYFSIVVFWAIMTVSGCSTLDEPYIGIDSDSSASETFTLTMQSDKMLPKKVTTRASDPKDDAEKEEHYRGHREGDNCRDNGDNGNTFHIHTSSYLLFIMEWGFSSPALTGRRTWK